MLKKILIIVLLVLIILAVFFVLKISSSPEKTVKDFYSFWMSYSENNSGASPVLERAYIGREDVTDFFVEITNSLIDSFGEGPGYDPVLCAQEIPQNIDFGQAYVSDDYAEIIIAEDFWGHEREVKVILRLIDKKWKINEIICIEKLDDLEISNPASLYCQEQKGNLEIRTNADGSQKGFCLFEDGSECEEWSFLRGECQKGDIFCQNLCGDGICQEVVCEAIGCPCAETKETCPVDCL